MIPTVPPCKERSVAGGVKSAARSREIPPAAASASRPPLREELHTVAGALVGDTAGESFQPFVAGSVESSGWQTEQRSNPSCVELRKVRRPFVGLSKSRKSSADGRRHPDRRVHRSTTGHIHICYLVGELKTRTPLRSWRKTDNTWCRPPPEIGRRSPPPPADTASAVEQRSVSSAAPS